MVFYSKHDIWLGLMLFGTQVPILLFLLFYSGLNLFTLLMFVVFFYTLWVWLGTKYVIQGGDLLVSCGFMHQKMIIDDIKRIRKTSNPVSAAACSMDRIEVICENKSVIISPKDYQKFMKSIKARNQDVILDEE